MDGGSPNKLKMCWKRGLSTHFKSRSLLLFKVGKSFSTIPVRVHFPYRFGGLLYHKVNSLATNIQNTFTNWAKVRHHMGPAQVALVALCAASQFVAWRPGLGCAVGNSCPSKQIEPILNPEKGKKWIGADRIGMFRFKSLSHKTIQNPTNPSLGVPVCD